MTLQDRIRQKIIRFRPADRFALKRFQREVFGERASQLDDAHFSWLFEHNPFNDESGPQVWIYPNADEVVGQQAGIPFALKVGDRQYRGSWAIDLMVSPKYRLRGIGPVITQNYADTNDITIGMGLTDLAYKAFRRAGWTDLGMIPLYVRPLDPRRMLAGRGRNERTWRAIAAGLGMCVKLLDIAANLFSLRRGLHFVRIDRFDERVDGLWRRICSEYPVIARRDHESLSWRFDKLPNPNDYQRFYMLRGDTLCGYAVLRVGWRHGSPAGFIVDYLAPRRWMTPLFGRCLQEFRRCGVAAVYWAGMHPESNRRLRLLGFARRASDAHIMFRVTPGHDRPPSIVSDPASWFLTIADSDIDHPRTGGSWAEQAGQPGAKDALQCEAGGLLSMRSNA